jgi:hypothetical protein
VLGETLIKLPGWLYWRAPGLQRLKYAQLLFRVDVNASEDYILRR